MLKHCKSIAMAIFALLTCCTAPAQEKSLANSIPAGEDNFYYIDNGKVRLGVDMNAGGSIFYFAESKTGRNLLNHYDKGRFIQQSYYGDKDGSMWADRPWSWNPIQGGGYKGEPAKIMEQELSKKKIYIQSRPKQWASGVDAMDAIMAEVIELKGNVAHIRYTFTYTGEKSHAVHAHELPAVFADADLPNLYYYDGDKPWTGDDLSVAVPGWPNEARVSNENWAAYTDDDDWGIGVYTPGTDRMTTYRFKGDGDAGPRGSACSYFAPVRKFAITPGLVFEYDIYLVIGHIDEIREAFVKINKKNK